MRKNKTTALMLAAMMALPLAASPALAEESDIGSQSDTQAAGYIGQLSKDVIASGNLWRLESRGSYSDHYLDGDNLKARIKFWHDVALDTVALDHTPAGENGAYLNQGGPTRASRALAMIQIAVFDALNAIEKDFKGYTQPIRGFRAASADAAVAFAAHRMLKRLYPGQRQRLREILNEDKARIKGHVSRSSFLKGKSLGILAARQVIDARRGDRSRRAEPNFGEGGAVADGRTTFFGTPVNGGTTNIGEWEPDPNTPEFSGDFNLSLGAFWGRVTPFVLRRGDQFRAPVPPLAGSVEYAQAFAEVAAVGGSPENVNTPSTGTDETRFAGNYWGYDGVPLVGVPPRIYNQIAIQVAGGKLDNPVNLARYLAMVNVAMADAAIAAWDSKYFYNFWRPVTGIRRDDGAANTLTDPTWNPVGVSVINTDEAIRATPPFPAYPSGHAAFGATTFEVMRSFFGNDTPFTFVSDEFNGEGFDPFFPSVPRPFVPVRFETLTDAQVQNGASRIYNGVHWKFDDTAGQQMGVDIARFLLEETRAFQPRAKR